MKFHEMPYERVQLPDVTHAYEELIKELQEAKSGEEQFAVHQRYYEMRGHVTTQMTIAPAIYIARTMALSSSPSLA